MNPFLKLFFIIFLALSSHFSAFADDDDWKPSEENCSRSVFRELENSIFDDRNEFNNNQESEEKCWVKEALTKTDNSGNTKPLTDTNNNIMYGSGAKENDCKLRRELEYKKEQCKEWKEEAKSKKEEEKDEEERKIEEQQYTAEQIREDCRSAYSDVLSQRDRIESQVQEKQHKLDEIEDEITKAMVSISELEDKVRDEILQLRENERNAINQFKQKINQAEKGLQGADAGLQTVIEEIEDRLYESASKLEKFAIDKQNACSKRSMQFLNISVECYNQTLTQVTKEREELFKRIRTGRYEASNVSSLFQMDSQNIDQTFQRRLNALHARCFSDQTGESLPQPGQSLTVQIPCDLKAFEQRSQSCKKKNSNLKVCPVKPGTQMIEQEALNALRGINQDTKKEERARTKALKDIQKLKDQHKDTKTWMAKDLADLEEQLRLTRKDFKEKHERAENKLLRVHDETTNKILQLERNKTRLLASDPARHFEEQILVAEASCCSSEQVNPPQCALLQRYGQDAKRLWFASIRELPVIRSVSVPAYSRKKNTSQGTR